MKVLITGPSGVGKTCLLGSINVAAARTQLDTGDHECRLQGISPTLRALFQQAGGIVLGEEKTTDIQQADSGIPRSTKVSDYQFSFEVTDRRPKRLFSGKQSHAATFQFLDGPGGALWGDSHGAAPDERLEEFRKELIQHGRQADSLMLCIDATDSKSAASFFKHLAPFLWELTDDTLPFRRIVIVLTKADQVFLKSGRGNFDALSKSDPWTHACWLLNVSLAQLLQSVDNQRTQFACGWASAYGFDANGSANFDPQTNRLQTCSVLGFPERINSWQPYHVLHPLIYLASGAPCLLRVATKEQIRETYRRQFPHG